MAGTSTNDFAAGAPFYLDSNQQDLLLAALASNQQQQDTGGLFSTSAMDAKQHPVGGSHFPYPVDAAFDASFFTSPQQSTPSHGFHNHNGSIDESPFVDLDYLDGDHSFDFDGENGDLMIGALPGDSPTRKGSDDGIEKRKSPEDDVDDPDGGGKRREPDDKQAKKPGRKPLTSEPTTKRKAQNRAAQRAFRERKEKHLKDLEMKVSELEKASDATNHENGLLRAHVQRLQVELREYRKRLSLNSTGLNRAPAIANGFSSMLGNANNAAANANFHFDFPKFGNLPGSSIFENGPLAKSSNKSASISPANGPVRTNSHQNSKVRSLSPRSQANASNAKSPHNNSNNASSANGARQNSTLNGFFSGIDHNATTGSNNTRADSSSGQSRVFQFNSGSSTHSDSNSPSASSNSQGLNSSCDTSPEPSYNSPNNPVESLAEGYVCHGNTEAPTETPVVDVHGIDFFANQNGGQFDPALFGDYRDSQAAVVGEGDFTGGFFNDAFPITDFGSPFLFGDSPAVQKPSPLEEIERLQDGDGDEEVVPGEDVTQMLNCHKIWDKLSARNDFKNGTIDIDNLCSELRAKARCSESGVVVDHKDVEAALKKLPEQKSGGL